MRRNRGGRYPGRGYVRQSGTCPRQQRQRQTREDRASEGGVRKSSQKHNKDRARENNRG